MERLSRMKVHPSSVLNDAQAQQIYGGRAWWTSLGHISDYFDDRDNSGTLSPGDIVQIWYSVVAPEGATEMNSSVDEMIAKGVEVIEYP